MIYLSISVNAEIVTDKVYYVCVSDRSQTNLRMAQINAFPYTISGLTDYSTLFISWHTTQVIQDNTIVVAQLVIDNLRDNPTTPFQLGIGQLASGAITNANNGAFYLDMSYDQEIISTTVAKISDGTRITVTFKANGFTNNYPFIRLYPMIRSEMGYVVKGVRYDLYQSIEEAAGSGVTPEEMRDVLDSWSEEELLPGIQDSVQQGVTSGMEEALENEKQEASADGAASAEELQGAIDEVLGDVEDAQKPFEDLGSALAYDGQSAILTFPGMNVPFLGEISQPVSINLTQKLSDVIPSELLTIIRSVLSLALVVFPPLEALRLINMLLDKKEE